MARPNVSVIVPFRGSATELTEVVDRLAQITFHDDDELILVWNSGEEIPPVQSSLAQLRVLPACAEESSYYARNVGVRSSRHSWLLFIDGDCWPAAEILDEYFASGEVDNAGLIAGKIDALPGSTLVERYALSRAHLDQQKTLAAEPLPYGQTANLLVSRSAWEAVGGFAEGINSGGDADFCWRAQYAGVELRYAASAIVRHRHRQTVGDLWEQHIKYGRGARWTTARHRLNSDKGPPVVPVLRAAGRFPLTVARGNPELISFAFLDVVSWAGLCVGWFRSNTAAVIQPPGSQTAAADD